MKRIAFAFSGLLFIGLTACNDATSKINGNESAETSETPAANESTNNNGNASNTVDASSVEAGATPAFSFEEETHDFGQIQDGEVVTHDFTFTNTGDAPLIITNAKGSCGCTVPQWPREPIAPGEQGTIQVKFNSQGKPGNQNKTVTLNANTVPNTKVLRIQAQVVPAATEEAQS